MKIINLIIALVLSITIVSCQKEVKKLDVTMTYVGDCLENKTDKDSAFSYHSSISTLNIHKYSTAHPCEGEINVSAEIKDNVISITEQSSMENKCTCPKNITYTIGNITSGSYQISINGKIIGDVLIY